MAIIARSCSSLVSGSCWQEAGTGDTFPCCCCYCWQDMVCGGSDGDGDDSYSELVDEISSSARATI